MTEKERIDTNQAKFAFLVNGLVFLSSDKDGGLENDAMILRVKKSIKDLIRHELKDEVTVTWGHYESDTQGA